MTTQNAYRHVASYRIKKDRFERFKAVCKKYKLSHCIMTEVLIDKFIRGEIVITSQDLDIPKKENKNV